MATQKHEQTTHILELWTLKIILCNQDNLEYIDGNVAAMINRYTISVSDVYLSIAGTVPASLNNAYLTENAAKLVIINELILNKDYLVNALSAPIGQEQIKSKTMSTSQPKLALFRIEEIEIPMPPLAIQQKIAIILNRANALIEKRKTQIEKFNLLVKSQFVEMFGDPVVNPKGWEVMVLKEACTKITDGTHFSPKSFESGAYRYIIAKNIKTDGFDFSDLTYIDESIHKDIWLFREYSGKQGKMINSRNGNNRFYKPILQRHYRCTCTLGDYCCNYG